MNIMNYVKFSIILVISSIIVGNVSASETKDYIEIDITVTNLHPDVNETFELRVTITNHQSTEINSGQQYGGRV